MFGWLKKAVNHAGAGLVSGINSATRAIGKVPVVGGGLKGAFSLTVAPFKLTGAVLDGRRLDRAMMDHFKDQLGAVKDIAPYAQTILSFVPGVGNIASGAIGAGLALAQGQPITKALIEATKSAMPGGVVAKSVFSIAQGVMDGKPIEEIGLSAIPGMTDVQKTALTSAIKAAKDVAAGKNVAESVYKQAYKQLPATVQKAMAVGIAVGHGANLQKTLVKNVKLDDIKGFGDLGKGIIGKNAMLTAGAKTLLDPKVKTGFHVAMGLTQAKLKPIDIVAVRNKLPPNQTKGFDIGMSTFIGMNEHHAKKPAAKVTVKSKHSTVKHHTDVMTPTQQFGYFTAKGVAGQPVKHKVAMLKTLATHPETRVGISAAVKDAVWWKKLLTTIGIHVN